MQPINQFISAMAASEAGVLSVVFLVPALIVVVAFLLIRPVLETRRRRKSALGPGSRTTTGTQSDGISQEVEAYYESALSGDPNSLRTRLVQAGYFSPKALFYFNAIRFVVAVAMFMASFWVLNRVAALPLAQIGLLSAVIGSLGFIVCNFVLEYMARGRQDQYRRTFPDFVDMLVVCTEAGLSIEAAANRVAREFLNRDRAFGIHLGVMMLEVRAGKRLRDALNSLAERTGLEEAKALSTLFRQSEELGVSMTRALRTHSHEMRRVRVLRAEEKANVLPVKMLIPLGAFVFPVTLVIVIVPVFISIVQAFSKMGPPA